MSAVLTAVLLLLTQDPTSAPADPPTEVAPAEAQGKRSRYMDAGGAANATLNDSRSAAVGDPERRVCKKVTSTGSRLGAERVCKSAREWAELQRDSREAVESRQRAQWSN